MPIREFSDNAADPKIRGYLHLPDTPRGDGLVLSHGAGSNAMAPLLVALAETFCANGFTVLRCDLPYRQSRSFGPPGPGDAARDRAGLKNALAALRKIISRRLFLGGHSYGGRQSSMLCAEEPGLVSALLLLSYPALFVQGTRDPFGSIAEMERALKMTPAKTKLMTIEGAGHDLGFKGKAKQETLPRQIFSELSQLLS
jgi:predicted alpha/beta-hydrolase family hydrolase